MGQRSGNVKVLYLLTERIPVPDLADRPVDQLYNLSLVRLDQRNKQLDPRMVGRFRAVRNGIIQY